MSLVISIYGHSSHVCESVCVFYVSSLCVRVIVGLSARVCRWILYHFIYELTNSHLVAAAGDFVEDTTRSTLLAGV